MSTVADRGHTSLRDYLPKILGVGDRDLRGARQQAYAHALCTATAGLVVLGARDPVARLVAALSMLVSENADSTNWTDRVADNSTRM